MIRRTPSPVASSVAALLAATLLLPAAASAQYFGRNKVQYDDFDFRILKTEHFDIHFYPEEERGVRDVARMSERWYERFARTFQYEFKRKKPLILYADHADFQQTNTTEGTLSEATGGFTESLKDRVVMPLTGSYGDTDHVLGHELVHAFQYDIAQSRSGGGLRGLNSLPLWLIEGMAEYMSVGRDDPLTAMWLRDAAIRDDLPTYDQLNSDPRFFPYRYGQALWAFIAGTWGDDAVPSLYRLAIRARFPMAVERVLGAQVDSLFVDWHRSIRETYLPTVEGRTLPDSLGRRVLAEDLDAGSDMNVGPALSPDGSRVIFLSSRDLFTIDLYLADAETGEVLDKLSSASTNPHFDALRFVESSGSWSPDGERFAFVVFEEGDNRIAIIDVEERDVERRIPVDEVGALSNPAWSPDGRHIAFSGMDGGISDLYLMEVASGKVRRLTDDRHADLQPAWSPDGETLAFVTDRGPETDFEKLTYSEMSLALIDVETGEIETLDAIGSGKRINPQFSPDGRSLFFISDADGFSDVYRVSLETGELRRVTKVATGISGITGISPALSVAREEGSLMVSVFKAGGYSVSALDPAEARGEPVDPGAVVDATVAAGSLPPVESGRLSLVSSYLEDPEGGLPPADVQYPVADYDAGLQLDYVGQPSVGVGVDRFGTAVGGGASFFFSDMLGNRRLGVLAQANGGVKDIGGQAVYQNRKDRWNWTTGIGHIPYLTGFQTIRPADDGVGFVVDRILQRVFFDQASVGASYPFSSTRRAELGLSFTRLSFDFERERITTAGGGFIVDRDVEEIDCRELGFRGCDPINQFQATAALVGDHSFFGFTSPIRGGRWRLEVQPTLGTFDYYGVLGDYRRYFSGRPVTLAFRGLHFGRYGEDADTDDLNPLFLGYETLVRGYSSESFDVSECSAPTSPTLGNIARCPAFDRLVGSRLAVANVEVRVPFLGFEQFGIVNFPYLPTELLAFFDAGLAWSGDESVDLSFETEPAALADLERVPVFSAGAAARFNVLGALIVQLYYAHPFQRPEKGAHFGWVLSPGW